MPWGASYNPPPKSKVNICHTGRLEKSAEQTIPNVIYRSENRTAWIGYRLETLRLPGYPATTVVLTGTIKGTSCISQRLSFFLLAL